MKVLWFADSPALASVFLKQERVITGWIDALQQQLMQHENITLGVAFPYGIEGTNTFRIDNVTYYSFPYPKPLDGNSRVLKRWKHQIEPDSVIESYLKVIEEFDPDIIHIFGTEAPFGLIIPHTRKPVVIHIQGNLTIYSHKWFSGVSKENIRHYSDYKAFIKAFGLWHLYFLFNKRASRERLIMENCKFFMGRTDWDRRITRVLSPEAKYYKCEELLRNDFYESTPWLMPSGQKVNIVSTVSPMVYKGLETVLETAVLLKEKLKLDFEWKVAGIKGTEEIVTIIEKSHNKQFANYNINFKGSLKASDLLSTLRQSHVYVHPSHIENSPNSVCEAMMTGMPVIATFTGGTSSMLADGLEGILIQDGDPYMMAGSIVELVENKGLMEVLGANARKRAFDRHDKQKAGKNLLKIYEAIINETNMKI